MDFKPVETEGLVVESPNDGFKLVPAILHDMRPDEVLVEMAYSGICHTDVFGASGGYTMLDFPAFLGHEGAGIIRAIGSDVRNKALKVGDSVILSFNHCGNCRNCSTNRPACCSNFEALNITGKRLHDASSAAKLSDGRSAVSQFFGQSSFLRHSIVSQYSVVPCPYPNDLATYAALGCGFQTGAGTVLNALKPKPNDSLLVFGVGTVGLAAIMAAKYLNLAQIIAVDIVDSKLDLARELGATHVINSKEVPDYASEIRTVTGGGANFAVDCTGVSTIIDTMLDCICCGGTATIVGVPRPDYVLKLDPIKMLHENKTLKGVCQGDSISTEFIPQMMELHRSGHFPIEKLCTSYPAREIDRALSDTKTGQTTKAILQWIS